MSFVMVVFLKLFVPFQTENKAFPNIKSQKIEGQPEANALLP